LPNRLNENGFVMVGSLAWPIRPCIKFLSVRAQSYGHNRTATAKSLGLNRAGRYKKLRKYGLLDRLV